MAKMFYTLEEVIEKLGISKEQIDTLVENGSLREFRDGAKIMLKVDEVDYINPVELSGSGEIPLAPADSSDIFEPTPTPEDSSDIFELTPTPEELPTNSDDLLEESLSNMGSSIGLAPMDTGSQIGLMPGDSADQIGLDDSTEQVKDDTVITTHGTKFFDDSTAAEQDDSIGPLTADDLMAEQLPQKQEEEAPLTPDFDDQISLDSSSSGSGSGLLDLSREADDTSLGAELLEEIYPSAEEGTDEPHFPSQLGIPSEEEVAEEVAPEGPEVVAVAPRAVSIYDPTSGIFGVMLIVPFAILLYLTFAATSALIGVQPTMVSMLAGNIWYIMGGAAVAAGLIVGGGLFMMGKAGQPRKPKVAKPKKEKTKKEKPKKEKTKKEKPKKVKPKKVKKNKSDT